MGTKLLLLGTTCEAVLCRFSRWELLEGWMNVWKLLNKQYGIRRMFVVRIFE